MFSLSTYIQIFWACTVYRELEETEIRATITFIFPHQKKSDDSPPPPQRGLYVYGARS